jgi:hypothetical protein
VKDILPAPIYGAIEDHIARRAQLAQEGWEGGSDEEDTLTGELGATFRTPWSDPIRSNGDLWSWRMRYKKFRGRGYRAFEKESGADGILQIEVNLGSVVQFKGLLFQAKKLGHLNGNLEAQVRRMEELAPGGSAIFEYGPEIYRAIAGQDYLARVRLDKSGVASTFHRLGDFLALDFLACTHGLRGVYYNANRGLLNLPDGTAHRVSIPQRIMIEANRLE